MKTTDPKKIEILDRLKGGLIVSCQTQKDEPIYTPDMVVKMAECAKWAGAVGSVSYTHLHHLMGKPCPILGINAKFHSF